MLKNGQFRKVRYTDEGCSLFECLWCKKQVEARGHIGSWNFCPHCGKSWFQELVCRDRDTPAWWYKRYRQNEDQVVKTTSGEYRAYNLPFYGYQQPQLEWVIQYRTKWNKEDWSEWRSDSRHKVNAFAFDFKYIYGILRMRRAQAAQRGSLCKYEYRAVLRKL